MTNRWSAAKGDTKYTYDSLGNLTNIDYAVSTDVRFAYDELNRLTNMVDSVGATKFTYNNADQLLTEDGPFASDTLTNVYWSRMRTNLSLAQPTGVWTNSFGYSATHRITSVTSPAGTFTYYYDSDPSDRLNKLALPNSSTITNGYDALSRLTNTALKNSSSVVLDAYAYQYNRLSQRTNDTRNDNSTVAYTYDNIGQLTVANSSVNAEDRGYFYDAAWNLNRRTNNGATSTFVVNTKNELTNAPNPFGTI